MGYYIKNVHITMNFFEEDGWFPCTDEYFYKNKMNKSDGHYPECKQCSIKKSSKWQKDNPEWYKENMKVFNSNPSKKSKIYWRAKAKRQRESGYCREWSRNNPDKQRGYNQKHRNHDISDAEYQSMLKVFNHSCAYCGMTLDESYEKYGGRLHNDHVDDEGYNDLRNDVPACKVCNSSKHQFDMEEWYREQEFFSQERLDKINWWTTEGYEDYIEEKPPYIIKRQRHKDDNNYDFNLWSVDEKRNINDIIFTGSSKKEILEYIKEFNIIY
jgi:hypothetical protein